jgi:hypothetical protein
VDLWCGTPPQRQTLIINTGGHGTAFPCSDCHNDCGLGYHTDRYFQNEMSLTFHQLTCSECMLGVCTTDDPSRYGTCGFGLAYMEGSSWFATEVRDHCYIGGLHNKPISIDDKGKDDLNPEHAVAFGFDLNFGCQTEISGLFRTQLADGILAMDNSVNSFWYQMFAAGKLDDELFSLCYVRQQHADRNGTEAGAMTLGGSDDRLHLSPMVFSKHEDVWGLNYGVLLRKIHLRAGGGGDSTLAAENLRVITLAVPAEVLNEGGVIIESGTTDTYMTRQLAEPFRQAWSALTSVEYDNELPLAWTYEQIQTLPTILFQFEGSEELNKEVALLGNVINLAGALDPDNPYDVVIAVPPNHYMEYDDIDQVYVPRFYMEENPAGVSTIGANTMMGHDVLFDAKNHRIGWAESHCDYSHLVNQAGFDINDKKDPKLSSSSPDGAPNDSSSSDRMCSSFGCRGSFILVVSFFGVLLLTRKAPGKLGTMARGITGGSGYRNMPANGDCMGNDSELELRVSYPDTSCELS